MRFAHLPSLGFRAFAAAPDSGVTYLLRDEFTTDAAAPLLSPRTCEPGPGTLTIVDTRSELSISSGKLSLNNTAVTGGNPGLWGGALSRQAGLATITQFAETHAGTSVRFGFDTNLTGLLDDANLYANNTTLRAGIGTQDIPVGALTSSADYVAGAVLRGTGAFILIKGGAFSDWTLVWVATNGSAATVYPAIATVFRTATCDYMRVSQFPAPWTTDYGIADVHATPSVSGTDYAGQASAIIDQVVTAPASLAGEAGYWFRKQDSSNGYKAYFDSAGAFRCDCYVAGTPTNVVNVAGVITGSGTRTIRVIADGTSLRFYTLSGTTWTQRGGTITDSNFSGQTTITPFADASWTGGGGSIGQLDSWPRTLSGAALAALNAV